MKIIPAIMPSSFKEMEEEIDKVKEATDMVQLDVMDGQFTKEVSWPYVEGGAEEVDSISKEEMGFPYWKDVSIETDLMVKSPEMVINLWLRTEIQRIVVHLESTQKMEWVLENVAKKIGDMDENAVGAVKLGIAVNTSTPNAKLEKWADRADFVQFMGIEEIGFQGKPFDEKVLEKIKIFREKYPAKEISVDGGVNLENAPRIIEAGADRLVIGSAIFNAEDPQAKIKKFEKLIIRYS